MGRHGRKTDAVTYGSGPLYILFDVSHPTNPPTQIFALDPIRK